MNAPLVFKKVPRSHIMDHLAQLVLDDITTPHPPGHADRVHAMWVNHQKGLLPIFVAVPDESLFTMVPPRACANVGAARNAVIRAVGHTRGSRGFETERFLAVLGCIGDVCGGMHRMYAESGRETKDDPLIDL